MMRSAGLIDKPAVPELPPKAQIDKVSRTITKARKIPPPPAEAEPKKTKGKR